MAQIRYRANLSAKDFVFFSQNWGRSVILKQYDQNFSRQIVSPTDPDKDIGIPQIYYGHNIMPASQGFQSIGYQQVIANTGIAGTPTQVLKWESSNGSIGYFLITQTAFNPGVSATYNIYGYTIGVSSTWTLLSSGIVQNSPAYVHRFTVALVGGQTYLYIPLSGCYSYDGTTFAAVTLTGLTASQIIGITASYGYMIAWSTTTVAWSSTVSATDFTPSLITGAGGGSIQALKGGIRTIVYHTFGFIAFSDINCVAAVYSGNSRFPFNYREVIGGGGVSAGKQLVDLDSESGNLYAYTSSGLQIVSVTQAQVVHPEVTNFVGGSRFEDFNDVTLQFTETDVTIGSFFRQLSVVANRYLVVSYGIAITSPITYTHAIVYDIAMKRWGKLKITHCQAFEGLFLNASGSEDSELNARASLCFALPDGSITRADFSQAATVGGTIILGKYQHARDRLITLLQVDLESVDTTANITVHDVITLDGKTWKTPVLLTPIANTSAPQFPARQTGMNHTLIIQGVWQLYSLMFTYCASGRR